MFGGPGDDPVPKSDGAAANDPASKSVGPANGPAPKPIAASDDSTSRFAVYIAES